MLLRCRCRPIENDGNFDESGIDRCCHVLRMRRSLKTDGTKVSQRTRDRRRVLIRRPQDVVPLTHHRAGIGNAAVQELFVHVLIVSMRLDQVGGPACVLRHRSNAQLRAQCMARLAARIGGDSAHGRRHPVLPQTTATA